MGTPIICDGCGDRIERGAGWKWARFKRKYRYRVTQWLRGGREKQVRYDFCRHCWSDLVDSLGDTHE